MKKLLLLILCLSTVWVSVKALAEMPKEKISKFCVVSTDYDAEIVNIDFGNAMVGYTDFDVGDNRQSYSVYCLPKITETKNEKIVCRLTIRNSKWR